MRAIATIALIAAVTGCSQGKPGEVMGIGEYEVTKTTLVQSGGKCQKDGALTWCFLLESVELGGQPARVDLYYRGHDDNAPLVEMLLSMRPCKRAKVSRALLNMLREPSEVLGDGRLQWTGNKVTIIAKVPPKGIECEMSLVANTEAERIRELRGERAKQGANKP